MAHRFGSALALTPTEIWVGAPGYSTSPEADQTGNVYRFDRSGTLLDEFTASDGEHFDKFGYSLSVDGTRVTIGAPAANRSLPSSGAAYLYDFDGTAWVETKLTPQIEVIKGGFGEAVALDRDRAAVGQVMAIGSGASPGRVAIFDNFPGDWIETSSLQNPETGEDKTDFGGAPCLRTRAITSGRPWPSTAWR